MRIVAGQFKGRRLAGPRGAEARPTSDKVREAMFSIIGPIDGFVVLDLFAGTGALGIEALSRGAGHATFVERDKNMRAVLQTNLQVTAADDDQRFKVVSGEAIDQLTRAASNAQSFDLVFLDPPYADAPKLATRLAKLLPSVLKPDAIVVAECDRRSPLLLESPAQDGSHPALSLVTERKYGDTLLRILKASEMA